MREAFKLLSGQVRSSLVISLLEGCVRIRFICDHLAVVLSASSNLEVAEEARNWEVQPIWMSMSGNAKTEG